MFNNSEQKLKIWAKIEGVFFSLIAIVIFLIVYSSIGKMSGFLLGLLIAFIIWFLAMLSAWALYSFADLVEYSKANNEILAYMNNNLEKIADSVSSNTNDTDNNE